MLEHEINLTVKGLSPHVGNAPFQDVGKYRGWCLAFQERCRVACWNFWVWYLVAAPDSSFHSWKQNSDGSSDGPS